ncbi:hypothetical protein P3342_005222 [Pyrenophora teres f. teres]|uniref:Uncharacterized protein n=2 Tax=Pyrenophora teres f. teres TaxID=97479 RepID=E3RDR4_PYRTT|nr:hypothetical protein PTT_02715 [Pyrenophora teres f. teres 0-1]KAE8846238.1 hypothetical protein HRS9139_00805 [Pyrenophora teres f. teres]KAE8848378.1 hypothetical protein PTNB85_02221 [Pyrenophora teres f. teres]KAE8853455.1 hypothetical protein HRS9122_00447 [Pyrenophora teres f. teres]KAE8868303.1 hypothetical protein PTNB29_02214 [Pyrenophora teres f. teres]
MDTADSTHLHAPGVGFVLKQYYKPPFSLNAPVRKYHLGIFTSLTHAQEAAQHALQCILSKLIDEGYHGRYCKDIDLKLRVLITVYADIVVNGYLITQENWLSELQMGTIEVWDPSWDAEVHRCSEDALFNSPCSELSEETQCIKDTRPIVRLSVEKPKPVVRLPVSPKSTTPKSSPITSEPLPSPTFIPRPPSVSTIEHTPQLLPTSVQYPEEQQETWSGSLPPLPMSASQPLPAPILPASQHEEELRPEWSRTRPS